MREVPEGCHLTQRDNGRADCKLFLGDLGAPTSPLVRGREITLFLSSAFLLFEVKAHQTDPLVMGTEG